MKRSLSAMTAVLSVGAMGGVAPRERHRDFPVPDDFAPPPAMYARPARVAVRNPNPDRDRIRDGARARRKRRGW